MPLFETGGIMRIGIVVFFALISSGCAIGAPRGDGYFTLSADARGMEAFARHESALITNGKATADQDTAAWKTQRLVERERTRRELKPTWLSGLFDNRPVVSGGAK